MEPKVDAMAMLKGQANIWQHRNGFVEFMVLKCAVDLGLPDIVHSHNGPISLSHLTSRIELTTSPNLDYLARIMRVLVRKNIFTLHQPSDGGEPLYGPTRASRWIARASEPNLIPMIKFWSDPVVMAPFGYLSECVRDGGLAFEKAHGVEVFDFMALNREFGVTFGDTMVSTAKIVMRAFLDGYKDGLAGVGTLVNLAGGAGEDIGEIVKANPHVKGINFDLPHVVATAPEREGVSHVGGDMFESIPAADAIYMKWLLHEWILNDFNNEDCIKILKNCRAAIPEKTGKVVIVDTVIEPYDDDLFEETKLTSDLGMMAITKGSKERTESEWKKLLELGGFPRYKIIKIGALSSIIEAFPN